ncbi:acetamidase/formamidase family protein [Galbitalea sp. SE-J8]|uniref:acetamidase/formamidase family protein n=1 Tax=Galbitalea sp. SE-J8 TaxID=3054952 RepID=UPI00259D1C06|nr:acetamidase/formamidase family protein [Galbitalea sp. SE-J8]MDM4762863.1 acetamidase/formamidase family protein [Galbitalea sp. SE-J8]
MTVLQPGTGAIRSEIYLPATLETVLWGRLPCATDAAVLTIEPGTAVTIDTLSHEGILEDQGRDPAAFFARFGVPVDGVLDDAVALAASAHPHDPAVDGPHVVTGPIAVRGARPGDLLAMTVVELLPRVPYGVISNRHGRGALPGEFPRGGASVVSVFAAVDETGAFGTMPRVLGGPHDIRFPLAPFLGTMGVAVAGDERPHSVPPGDHGGNIDIRLLVPGTTLYLPVQVPGALAYVGDPHFAQGDGEVALTAMEASLRATVRFDVVPAADRASLGLSALTGPFVATPEYAVPTGIDLDLDEAVRKTVRTAIAFLGERYGLDPEHALAYLSAATDFDISQVVDRVSGVHARIRTADFDRAPGSGELPGSGGVPWSDEPPRSPERVTRDRPESRTGSSNTLGSEEGA